MMFDWTPAIGQSGSYLVEFQASDGQYTVIETVSIQVGAVYPAVPDPFPFGLIYPPHGATDVDPTEICFSWPAAPNAQSYDLLVSPDTTFTSLALESRGLIQPGYCTEIPLAPGTLYYWKIVTANVHGQATYPVWNFLTEAEEGDGEDDGDDEEPTQPTVYYTSAQPLPPMEYLLISIPVQPENGDAAVVLGDGLGEYGSDWKLYRYESADGLLHEYPDVPPMQPGLAYLLTCRNPVQLNGEGQAVPTDEDFVVTIPPGLFYLGCPFPFTVSWSEVKVRKGEVTVNLLDPANQWISPILWKYEYGIYSFALDLEPFKGYVVENMSSEPAELLVPPRPQSE
jgi:hypothetical protein